MARPASICRVAAGDAQTRGLLGVALHRSAESTIRAARGASKANSLRKLQISMPPCAYDSLTEASSARARTARAATRARFRGTGRSRKDAARIPTSKARQIGEAEARRKRQGGDG